MKMELDLPSLEVFVNRQLWSFFGIQANLMQYLYPTMERLEACFKMNNNKHYKNSEGECYFSPFHSGQYAIFLYYLSNTIYKINNDNLLASNIYYLNKIMHSVDWYYEIQLPTYWGVEHPLGSVLGRAKYSNGFFIYQGCTVGGNSDCYPELGEHVILFANATILGESRIGDRVAISAGTLIKNEIVPSNCIVFGQSPNLTIREKDELYMIQLISKYREM